MRLQLLLRRALQVVTRRPPRLVRHPFAAVMRRLMTRRGRGSISGPPPSRGPLPSLLVLNGSSSRPYRAPIFPTRREVRLSFEPQRKAACPTSR